MAANKKILTVLLAVVTISTTTMQAQNDKKDFVAFNHLDLGVTIGSTGLGIDIASPFGNYVQVRTGFEIMPRFEMGMNFDIQSFDESGNMTEGRFDRMASRLEQFMGYKADSHVRMNGKPTLWNFKLLVDVFPFRNKHWHITGGFHWGPSKIAEAVNDLEDAPSLVAVNIYNNIYDRVSKGLPIYNDIALGSKVRFIGNKLYISSYAQAMSIDMKPFSGTVNTIIEGRAHPYYVYSKGADGWCNKEDLEVM